VYALAPAFTENTTKELVAAYKQAGKKGPRRGAVEEMQKPGTVRFSDMYLSIARIRKGDYTEMLLERIKLNPSLKEAKQAAEALKYINDERVLLPILDELRNLLRRRTSEANEVSLAVLAVVEHIMKTAGISNDGILRVLRGFSAMSHPVVRPRIDKIIKEAGSIGTKKSVEISTEIPGGFRVGGKIEVEEFGVGEIMEYDTFSGTVTIQFSIGRPRVFTISDLNAKKVYEEEDIDENDDDEETSNDDIDLSV
jgi:hypothetical protein